MRETIIDKFMIFIIQVALVILFWVVIVYVGLNVFLGAITRILEMIQSFFVGRFL
jgi:hypothetical protein